MSDEYRQTDDDALLSALIDEELAPGEVARLRARLAEDSALAARYEALRRTDRKLRRAFASAADEPVPEDVLRLLREDRDREGRSAPVGAAKIVPLPALRQLYRPPVALAAGIALFFLGFVLAEVLLPLSTPESGMTLADAAGVVHRDSPLHRVLESVPSSETLRLDGDFSATPRLTFKRADGNYCRLVEVSGESGVNNTLACREDGAWRLRLAAFSEGVPVSGDGYRPAAAARSPIVDRAIDGMIEGAPLGSEAEAELLGRNWSVNQSP